MSKRIKDLTLAQASQGQFLAEGNATYVVDQVGADTLKAVHNELGLFTSPAYFDQFAKPDDTSSQTRQANTRAFNKAMEFPGVSLALYKGIWSTDGTIDVLKDGCQIMGVQHYSGLQPHDNSANSPAINVQAHQFSLEFLHHKCASSRLQGGQNTSHFLQIAMPEITNTGDPDYDINLFVKDRDPTTLPAGQQTGGVDNENLWLPRGTYGHRIRFNQFSSPGPGDALHFLSIFNSYVYQNIIQFAGRRNISMTGGGEGYGTGAFVGRACPRSAFNFVFNNRFQRCRAAGVYWDNVSFSVLGANFIGQAQDTKTGGPTGSPRIKEGNVVLRGGICNDYREVDSEGHKKNLDGDANVYARHNISIDGESPYNAINALLGYGHIHRGSFIFTGSGGLRVANTDRFVQEPIFILNSQLTGNDVDMPNSNTRFAVTHGGGSNSISQHGSQIGRWMDGGEKKL